MSDSPRRLITIGQLADYAGVTIKAVRVYHERGLLSEPPRDASGYRRYDAEHAIQLVKVKTLADAGVPLARIRELLAATPADFAAAVVEIDENLRLRAEAIHRSRRRIAQLQAGDGLFVSSAVSEYLERLRALGIGEHTVGLEREIWILLQAVSPERAAEWAAEKLTAIEDPEFRALYRDYDAAFDWSPDDPRLPALAARTREWFVARGPEATNAPPPDPTITRLAAASASAYSPAWTRLAELTRRANAHEGP